jgi:glutamate-ammonia-ligase adenylyltransferase
VILGLGKLGGREPNYHSDLDVIFLYDSKVVSNDPMVSHSFEDFLRAGITSQFFFSELAASITQFVAHSPRHGRLFEIDSRLRPTGKSGSLAVSTDEFERYFASGQGQLWERQALCKARPVFGSATNADRAMSLVHNAITVQTWQPEMAKEIYAMRMAIQKDCSERNLKRGEGGTVDVEFAIQMLQLKHATTNRSVLVPGTLEAIEKLVSMGYLNQSDGRLLTQGYQLLRNVEARLRLMNTSARHDLPDDEKQLSKLAYLLNYQDASQLSEAVSVHRGRIRSVFDSLQ